MKKPLDYPDPKSFRYTVTFKDIGTGWIIINKDKGGDIMAQDPVCKMNIEESEAAATSIYKEITYYFCSIHCKEDFEKEPEKYVEV